MTEGRVPFPTRSQQRVLLLLAVPFPLLTFIYAWRHRTQVPLMDLLYLSFPLVSADRRGEDVWAHLLTPFNGLHFPITGGLVTIANARLTDWNLHYEQGLLVGLLCLNYALLLRLLWGSGRYVFWGSLVPVTALFWSVSQDTSLYIGIHNVWLFVNLSLLGSVLLLDSGPAHLWRLIAAGLLGFLATFSLINGWGLFLALAPLVFLRVRTPRLLWVWGGFTVGTLGLVGWILMTQPGGFAFSTGMAVTDTSPTTLLLFGPMLLGSGFTVFVARYTSAFVFGLLGGVWLAANGVLLWRAGEYDLLRRWGPVAAFVLMSAALITLGRYQTGLLTSQALHYNTLLKYLWIVLVVTVVAVIPHLRQNWLRRGVITLGALVLMVHVWSNLEVWYGKQWYSPQAIAGYEQCLADYPSSGETACLDRLVLLELDQIVTLVDEMYALRVGFYRDTP